LRQEREAAKATVRPLRWGLVGVALVAAGAMALGTPLLHAASHTADVTIVANKTASGGFAFNGYQRGGMTITVPVGWQVVVHFENADTTGHSLAVLPSGAHQQVTPPSSPAFAGATTPNLSAGLPKGPPVTFTFDATKAGTYELVCGVPGHAISGQWDVLVVSATADAPSVTPPGAATITVK
jgi:sulfocyanin